MNSINTITIQESFKENSVTAFENLNNDCLEYIFNLLPVADRVRVERVNIRCQEVAKKSWSNLKAIDFNAKSLGLKIRGKRHEYPSINEYEIEEIFKRSGKYLEVINS